MKIWEEEDFIPSEPVFVARPGASEEDDGKWWTVSCEGNKRKLEPVTSVTLWNIASATQVQYAHILICPPHWHYLIINTVTVWNSKTPSGMESIVKVLSQNVTKMAKTVFLLEFSIQVVQVAFSVDSAMGGGLLSGVE